jgi:hypothetical protein
LAAALALAACSIEPRIEPAHGPLGGGQEARIHAPDLAGHGGALVLFGDQPATGVVVEDRNVLRLVTPPGIEEGRVPVTIELVDGTRPALELHYRYAPSPIVAKEKGQ